MIWLSIDIGYYNMAFVQFDTETRMVLQIKKVDISTYSHNEVDACDCKLNHTRHVADMFVHMLQEYRELFDGSDRLFVERQPPTGLTSIESLYFYTFRDKCTLVSPNSMHKHFNIGQLEYESRKEKTEEIAFKYLKDNSYYLSLTRKHDVADALCFLLYELSKVKKVKMEPSRLPFENYRFVLQVK